jgi:hypothetical protein
LVETSEDRIGLQRRGKGGIHQARKKPGPERRVSFLLVPIHKSILGQIKFPIQKLAIFLKIKEFRRLTQRLRPPARRSYGSERKGLFLDGNTYLGRGVFLNTRSIDNLFLNRMNSRQGIIKKKQETIF